MWLNIFYFFFPFHRTILTNQSKHDIAHIIISGNDFSFSLTIFLRKNFLSSRKANHNKQQYVFLFIIWEIENEQKKKKYAGCRQRWWCCVTIVNVENLFICTIPKYVVRKSAYKRKILNISYRLVCITDMYPHPHRIKCYWQLFMDRMKNTFSLFRHLMVENFIVFYRKYAVNFVVPWTRFNFTYIWNVE